jgi:hypothetical protein
MDSSVFRCGPILATDPVTRERIAKLYREQWDLERSNLARLAEIASRVQAATDPEVRVDLNRQGVQLRHDSELRNMELGLEIARLNGDARRVSEFEEALDHFLHPERWMPVYTPDPELHARRLRELGITK